MILLFIQHMVGRILNRKSEVVGITLEMLVVRFEHDRMTLRVLLEKSPKSWLTDLSLKKQMEQAITTLQGKAKVRRATWSRRAQEYETKLNQEILYQSQRLFATYIVGQTNQNNPIQNGKCIKQLLNAWRENSRRLKRLIGAAALRLEDLMDAA